MAVKPKVTDKKPSKDAGGMGRSKSDTPTGDKAKGKK